jgi:hypothetical protein
MQTTDLKQIKAAIFDQAFTGKARVMCPMGPVVAVRRRKGQILAMIRGWGKWYPVESVQISLIGVGRLHSFCPETCTLAPNPAQWDMRFLEKPFHTLHTGMGWWK